MRIKAFLLAALLVSLLTSGSLFAQTWPKNNPVPGGIAVLAIPQRGEAPPQVWFNNQRVYTAKKNDQWFAWVGINLNQKLGEATAFWRTKEGDKPLRFHVEHKDYAKQELTVAPKHVNLSAENLARVRKETPELQAAMNTFNPFYRPLTSFVKPVEGRHSSPFGFRRVFNGQARNPHSGLDIAAPTGTPIQAAWPGKVVAINDYFFNGKTLVLDHGQGFTSMYCHLSEFAELKIGDEVAGGELIGQVGATGRVTGPHLHWTLSLNANRVDPELFLP